MLDICFESFKLIGNFSTRGKFIGGQSRIHLAYASLTPAENFLTPAELRPGKGSPQVARLFGSVSPRDSAGLSPLSRF